MIFYGLLCMLQVIFRAISHSAPSCSEATMFEYGSNLSTIANCGSFMLEYFNSIKLLRVFLPEERDWIAWLRKALT